jgi:alpha-tubulin suppressor-like RCC1 family protein
VLYVTGSNMYGQLCVNETVGENVTTPYQILDVNMSIVSSFDAIRSSSYISFNDGSIGACGRNNFGQLGDGNNIDRFRTELEPPPDQTPLIKLYGGPSSESVFFVSESGATYATGLNDKGQLGVGDQLNRNLITLVDFGEGAQVPKQISASGDHTLSV